MRVCACGDDRHVRWFLRLLKDARANSHSYPLFQPPCPRVLKAADLYGNPTDWCDTLRHVLVFERVRVCVFARSLERFGCQEAPAPPVCSGFAAYSRLQPLWLTGRKPLPSFAHASRESYQLIAVRSTSCDCRHGSLWGSNPKRNPGPTGVTDKAQKTNPGKAKLLWEVL